jgi:hypothetical protein
LHVGAAAALPLCPWEEGVSSVNLVGIFLITG